MNLTLAVVIPILIIGFLFFLLEKSNDLPTWINNLSRNSSSIWTYGVIAITVLSIIKYQTSK